MLTALHSHLKADLQDALYLGTGIDVSIVCLVVILILLAEVHASRQFANHHEISSTQQFLFQGRLVQQTVERSYRPHIGIQAQLLAHGQQSLFRAHLGCRVVIILQVANGSKQHGVAPHANLVGSLWIGIAHGINGMRATEGMLILKLMSILHGNCIEYGNTLFHNLRADTIARKNSNFQFHLNLIYLMVILGLTYILL